MILTRSPKTGPVSEIVGTIGPILFEDYQDLCGESMFELIERRRITGYPLHVTIDELEFRKTDISGFIDLLEEMGIPTGEVEEGDKDLVERVRMFISSGKLGSKDEESWCVRKGSHE